LNVNRSENNKLVTIVNTIITATCAAKFDTKLLFSAISVFSLSILSQQLLLASAMVMYLLMEIYFIKVYNSNFFKIIKSISHHLMKCQQIVFRSILTRTTFHTFSIAHVPWMDAVSESCPIVDVVLQLVAHVMVKQQSYLKNLHDSLAYLLCLQSYFH
jgi:hypothetical protein